MQYFLEMMPIPAVSGEAGLLLLAGVVGFLWQAAGLFRSRQGYLLPVACGLTGLAGFLVNPVADSTSLVDLRGQLMQRETLLILCTAQMTLAAAAIMLNLWAVAQPNNPRRELAMGVFHCIPVPAIVLVMLLAEQQWLAARVGARPEWIGIWVGLMAVSIFGLMCLVCWLLGSRRQLYLHLTSSVLLGIVASLGTALNVPLPTTDVSQTAMESAWSLLGVLVIAVVLLLGGMAAERMAWRRVLASVAGSKRTS